MTTDRRRAEPLRKETERRSDERSAVRKGRIRETVRERIGGDAVSKATHSNERKRSENGERPAPEGYKFMSMQHKVASTTSQPIHPLRPTPTFYNYPAATSHRFPDRLFDTRPGVPIDLGRLKTPGNHRRQLLRAPLSGTSRRGVVRIHRHLCGIGMEGDGGLFVHGRHQDLA